ncbi:putative orf32 protein [Escherichia coli 180200]|nr:putative orf32 protein [Escherichia coli 180200]
MYCPECGTVHWPDALPHRLMLPRFADIFQQGNRWLNWLEKQPEGSVLRWDSRDKNHGCGPR